MTQRPTLSRARSSSGENSSSTPERRPTLSSNADDGRVPERPSSHFVGVKFGLQKVATPGDEIIRKNAAWTNLVNQKTKRCQSTCHTFKKATIFYISLALSFSLSLSLSLYLSLSPSFSFSLSLSLLLSLSLSLFFSLSLTDWMRNQEERLEHTCTFCLGMQSKQKVWPCFKRSSFSQSACVLLY